MAISSVGATLRALVAAARLAPDVVVTVDPLVERVFTEVERTFRDAGSVGDVARALGYTPGHLTTVVRERTGRPVHRITPQRWRDGQRA
jgi:hypothetical protein